VGIDILFMPNMEDGYYLLVIARQYISGWAEAQPLKQGTSEKVDDCFYIEVICSFRTPESVEVDKGQQNQKWTNRLIESYNISKITVTPCLAAANCIIERAHRPLAHEPSKLTSCPD